MALGALVGSACGGGEKDARSVSCSSPPPATKAVGPDSGLRGRIVWASNRAGGNMDLFAMAADGSGVRRLTRTPESELAPVWSRDGTEIAYLKFEEDFGSVDADTSPGQIKIINADGSGARELTAPEPQTGAATWSPDGQWVAFAAPGGEIDLMRTDGSQRRRLAEAEGDHHWPSWSPDGEHMLVTSSGSGREGLLTIGTDGSSPKLLMQAGFEGAWSPDGGRIAFVSARDGNPNADNPVDWNEEIYVMARDGSDVSRITRLPGNDHWPPAWSPDGTHIAFTSDGCGDNSEIFITDARGSRVLNATHHPGARPVPLLAPMTPR